MISFIVLIWMFYLALLFGFGNLTKRGFPQTFSTTNIFDEMYANLDKVNEIPNTNKRTFSTFNKHLEEFKSTSFDYNDAGNILSDYKNIFVQQDYAYNKIYISYEKELEANLTLKLWFTYNPKTKIAVEYLVIIDNRNSESTDIEKPSEIKSYLKQYHVTISDVEKSYDLVVKQLILKDWTDVYDSKFSTSDYDKIKVKTQWENW